MMLRRPHLVPPLPVFCETCRSHSSPSDSRLQHKTAEEPTVRNRKFMANPFFRFPQDQAKTGTQPGLRITNVHFFGRFCTQQKFTSRTL